VIRKRRDGSEGKFFDLKRSQGEKERKSFSKQRENQGDVHYNPKGCKVARNKKGWGELETGEKSAEEPDHSAL